MIARSESTLARAWLLGHQEPWGEPMPSVQRLVSAVKDQRWSEALTLATPLTSEEWTGVEAHRFSDGQPLLLACLSPTPISVVRANVAVVSYLLPVPTSEAEAFAVYVVERSSRSSLLDMVRWYGFTRPLFLHAMLLSPAVTPSLLARLRPEDVRRARDDHGNTALMLAAADGQVDLVQTVLPMSDVTAINDQGLSATYLAGIGGHEAVFRRLWPLGEPTSDDHAFWTKALYQWNAPMLQTLQAMGLAATQQTLDRQGWVVPAQPLPGETSLHRFAQAGGEFCWVDYAAPEDLATFLRFLLTFCSPTAQNQDGDTPLMVAVQRCGTLSVVQALLEVADGLHDHRSLNGRSLFQTAVEGLHGNVFWPRITDRFGLLDLLIDRADHQEVDAWLATVDATLESQLATYAPKTLRCFQQHRLHRALPDEVAQPTPTSAPRL